MQTVLIFIVIGWKKMRIFLWINLLNAAKLQQFGPKQKKTIKISLSAIITKFEQMYNL